MKAKSIIISILFLFSYFVTIAQSHNEKVTVEGTYRPQIKKSERLKKTPDNPKSEFNIPEYKTVTNDYDFKYTMDMETISPLSYSTTDLKDVAGNFLMAGIGTRLSPVFLFRHNSELSKNMSLSAGIQHNSTWLGLKDYPNSNYMNNAFNVSTTNRFNGFQLRSSIDYHYDMYHLYGFDNDSISFDDKDIRRTYNTLNIKSVLTSNSTGYKSFHDEIGLDYKYTGVPSATQEHSFNINGHLNHSNTWFGGDADRQMVALDVNMSANAIDETLFLMAFTPYFDMRGDFYRIHAGLRLDIKTYVDNGFGLYPDIQANLYIFRRHLEFYASLGGKAKINTFADVVAENPFVSTNSIIGDLGYEKTKIDFQAGIKAMITKGLDAHIGIRYRLIDEKMFYLPSSTVLNEKIINTVINDSTTIATVENDVINNTFSILNSSCSVLNFIADIHWKYNEKIDFSTDIIVNEISMDNTENQLSGADSSLLYKHAWYQPSFEWNLRGSYQYDEHWKFRTAVYVLGTRYALKDYNTIVKLNPAFDFKIGADYQYNKNLAFYGEITNLIHNKYQMYYNYPVYGFQIFVGFKYRFL